MECQNCRYLATPTEIVEGACPSCHRPYRDQPSPTRSDMEVRGMPAPGERDMGGNPLQEGILADNGWQHRQKRDESFASVHAALVEGTELPGYDLWKTSPPDPGARGCPECGGAIDPDSGQCLACGYSSFADEPDWDSMPGGADFIARVAAGPLQQQYQLLMNAVQNDPNATIEELLQGPLVNYEIDPQVIQAVQGQLSESGGVNLGDLFGQDSPSPENVSDVSVMDMREQKRHKQMRDFDRGLDDLIDQNRERAQDLNSRMYEHKLGWEPGLPGRGVVVDGGPEGSAVHTWSYDPQNPLGAPNHADYLQGIGLNPSSPNILNNVGLFYLDDQGNIEPQSSQLQDHHADAITSAEPRIQHPNNNFGGEEFGTFANTNVSSTPHGSWLVESDADFELENADVIPPGGQTIEVTSPVLHNGNLAPMRQLGVQVDGRSLDEPGVYQEYMSRSGTPAKGPITVTLSHDDPEALDLAKQMAEAGDGMHLLNKVNNVVYKGNERPIQPAEGIHDRLHQALGAFDAHVRDPVSGDLVRYRTNHEDIRNNYAGGPLGISHDDPQVVAGIEEFAHTGNADPLLSLQGQRQGRVAFNPLDAVGDAVGEVADVGQDIGLIPEDFSIGELAGTAAWLIPGTAAVKGAMTLPRAVQALGAGAAAAKAGQSAGLGSKVLNAGKNYLAFKGGEQALQGLNPLQQLPPSNLTQPVPTRGLQQLTNVHEQLTAEIHDWHPSSDPNLHEDPHEVKDGDSNAIYDPDLEAGGSDDPNGITGDPDLDQEFEQYLPAMILYYLSSSSARNHPDPGFQAFLDKLESKGLLEEVPEQGELDGLWDLLNGHVGTDDTFKEGNVPNLPTTGINPGHVPSPPKAPVAPQIPNPAGQTACPRCGAPTSPGATTCPQCGSGTATQQAQQQQVVAANPPCRRCKGLGWVNNGETRCTQCYGTGKGTWQDRAAQPQPSVPPEPLSAENPLRGQVVAYSPQEMQMLQTPQTTAPVGQGQPIGTPAQPIPQSDFSAANCPSCGYNMPAGSAVCPHCNQSALGKPAAPAQPQGVQPVANTKTAAPNHQGPHNSEQFAAVADLLHEEGREDEVPGMLAEPWNYAEELARVQNRLTQPPIDETQVDTPPQPAQEEAPPGATMPVPGMSIPQPMASANDRITAALEKHASPDSYAPRCPKCNSGTTGIVSDEGDCQCHACGNQWKKEIVKDFKNSFEYVADHDPGLSPDPNVPGVPAADQEGQRDIEREQDASLTWKDASGQPLQVGQEYEMNSPGWSIPDIVQVSAVKPEAIEVEIQGEFGLNGRTEISRKEVEMDQIIFEPTGGADEEIGDEGLGTSEDQRQDVAPGETSDLSTPHVLMTNHQAGAEERSWIMEGDPFTPDTFPTEWTKTAGKKYTPTQQREFIDEQGEARNRDKLNLAGTHYEEEDDDYGDFLFGL